MRRFLLLSVLFGAMPVYITAQDDLYFTPKKSEKKVSSSYEKIDDASTETYYVGSNRDVDEYNRHGLSNYFQKIGSDSLGNDIIEFHSTNVGVTDTLHVYPGANVSYNAEDDYAFSRRMSRFDDFYWYDPWYYGYGYSPYWSSRWGWYGPWYNGWYDPWYYSWYGWNYPYYHHYWNWGWSRPAYVYRGGITGTRNHGTVSRRQSTGRGNFSGYRGKSNRNNTVNNGNFNNRRNVNTYNNNNTMPRPSYNSGSFGGSRGGGGSSGGGSRGGGHFGGRR